MLGNSVADDIKYQFRYGNMAVKLIFVNVGVFLFFALYKVLIAFGVSPALYQLIIGKLETTAVFTKLATQPWSLFTYMFLHEGFFHILFNMLWLYWFGEIFILFLGDKKILPVYILGGLAGALFYIGAYNLIPAFQAERYRPLLGASASVYAIVFAAATISPDYEIRLLFFGPVRIKYIALISLLLGVISIPNGNNAGGNIAHMGGALFGYVYVKALQGGISFKSPMAVFGGLFKPRPKVKVTHRNVDYRADTQVPKSDSDQQKLDSILDKISRSGYDSLTKDEKDFLFHYSKK